jgi:hypothetical protein
LSSESQSFDGSPCKATATPTSGKKRSADEDHEEANDKKRSRIQTLPDDYDYKGNSKPPKFDKEQEQTAKQTLSEIGDPVIGE